MFITRFSPICKDGKVFAGEANVTRAEYWAMQGRLQGLYAVVREDVLEHVGALDFFLLLDHSTFAGT
jgi:hypothetical protein